VRLYPDEVVKPDELALDFDDAYRCARGAISRGWTGDQAEALAAIDAMLSGMSRGGSDFSEDLWLEPALFTDPRWERVRELALVTLRLFGWPLEEPPEDPQDRGASYVW
jgi:hypothetical protein